jgi:hypothetical protein
LTRLAVTLRVVVSMLSSGWEAAELAGGGPEGDGASWAEARKATSAEAMAKAAVRPGWRWEKTGMFG